MRAPLRHEHDATDLLHLRVVGRRDAVHVAHDLGAQVCDAHELLEHVLGEHVRVAALRAVVRAHVDVGRAQVQVGRGDGADAPVGLGGVGLLLVLRGGRHDQLLAVHVDRLGGGGVELRRRLVLRVDLGNLLALLRRRGDLHAEDDVADLRLGEARHVDVVLLAVVGEDEVLESHLERDPLLVGQSGPDVVRLRDCVLVGLHQHLAALVVHVQRAQNQNQAREGGVGADGAQPVVVDVEEDHLRLGGLENEVSKFLDLEAGLERQLQLAPLNHDVREIEQMHLERVEHALPRGDDLFGLLLDGRRADERRHLLRRLPLGQLTQALLARPHRCVDHL
mmetsp:Transcript_22047/g.55882  ORF Transcript_22047/g.55882 Transcript_22047/m.55882 type:complete len:336 (+) Transcript_22047:760-1767(+)